MSKKPKDVSNQETVLRKQLQDDPEASKGTVILSSRKSAKTTEPGAKTGNQSTIATFAETYQTPVSSSGKTLASPLSERLSVSRFLSEIPEIGPNLRIISTDEEFSPRDETIRYEVVEVLAQGGMGSVAIANDNDLKRRVAMKTILPEHNTSSEAIARFVAEAQATGQLEHPNIVPIHDLGMTSDGELYFTMKYVKGETLEEIIERLKAGDEDAHRKYSFTRRMLIVQQICDALGFAHSRGIIHRDLKPANIMIGPFGEVMVMDWGLAKVFTKDADPSDSVDLDAIDDEELTNATIDGAIVGTPVYMPPEQALGKVSQLDARSDIYSIGALIYEFVSLRSPFSGKTVVDVLRKVIKEDPTLVDHHKNKYQGAVPVEISYIVDTAMQKDPEQRYQSVEELKEEIEKYLEGRFDVRCPHTALKRFSFGLGRFIDNHVRLVMVVLLSLMIVPIVAGVVYAMGLY